MLGSPNRLLTDGANNRQDLETRPDKNDSPSSLADRLGMSVARVARVVGPNETSHAPAVHQCPTLVCLEAMVKLAQTVEEVENCYTSRSP